MTDRVVLVGMPGVGKSTIGPALAGALSVPFCDLDDEIGATAGLPCAELLRRDGEAAFRVAEAAALRGALPSAGVLATGGGVVEDAGSRALLTSTHVVIHLVAPVDVLLGRLGGAERPLLVAPTSASLDELWSRRAPLYAEVADAVVDATADVDEVVAAILAVAVAA